jgi:hypothetical protein
MNSTSATIENPATNFNNLPDDIIIEIFSYLNHKDILNAVVICHRWENIIKSTNNLKSRFKSIVILRRDCYLIHRFYPSEFIDNVTLDMTATCENMHQEVMDFLQRSATYIKTLTLKTFFMAKAFKVLKMMPNLEKLIIINLRRDNTEEMLELPKLKHLELVNALRIGRFLTTPDSIKTLKIMGTMSITCKRERRNIRYEEELEKDGFDDEISNFLGRCVNLKELWISNVHISNIELNCSKFMFNLETLLLEYIVMPTSNFLDLLINQKSSLKNFSMMICEPQPEIMDLVLFDMNLEELEIDTAMIPKDYEVKDKISKIKRLIFKSYKSQEYLRQQEYNKVRHDAVDDRQVCDNKAIDFGYVKNRTRVFKLRGKLISLSEFYVGSLS